MLDADSAAVNNITVNLNDPLDLFNLRDPVVFHGVNGTHMLINTGNVIFQLLNKNYLNCIKGKTINLVQIKN